MYLYDANAYYPIYGLADETDCGIVQGNGRGRVHSARIIIRHVSAQRSHDFAPQRLVNALFRADLVLRDM